MKRKPLFVFWGIMFLLSGFVGLAQYGVVTGLACFAVGVLLLVIPFKSKSGPQEAPTHTGSGQLRSSEERTAFYRDLKTISFPVAGVTFSNEKGRLRSRQTILQRILFNDPPFDCAHSVTLEKYLYENEPAYYVKVNDYIIGNVPREFVFHVDTNADRPYRIDDFQVYGGRKGNFLGASLKIVFLDTAQN